MKKIADLIQERIDAQMRATIYDAMIMSIEESFLKKDGQKPKNLLVTADGRKIPTEMIEEVLLDVKVQLLQPLRAKIQEIEETEL